VRTALSRITLVGALVATAVAVTDASASPEVAAQGSVEQVYVTGLAGAPQATLLDSHGKRLATKRPTPEGGVVFYGVKPGTGYRVRVSSFTSDPVTVHTKASTPWDTSFYNQPMTYDGYGYLTTRDGTKLAYTVHPPTVPAGLGTPDVTLPAGPVFAPPYPTLIEYSGYGYAQPSGPQSGIAVLANAMGFAVVDINMRGTGCSGGAFNFFEALQSLDGYDIVETVAHQPWVKGNKVGMMGISYGGISQLFTAQTQPPSLAAISPLSVIDATPTTLYPGGILNTGFAVAWAKERQQNAQAATGPGKGQGWAWDRIQGGDQVCKANQALHGEAQDLMKTIRENSHYDNPAYIDSVDPVQFVHKIKVPTFMACQWQDEQTGGHCPALVRNFTGTRKKWFTFTNGAHIDSLDPATYVRWFDFLNLYVAKQAPAVTAAVTMAASPVVYQEAMGLPQNTLITMPPDPIQAMPSYDQALAAFEALPSVRVLFDNGAGKGTLQLGQPGDPYAGFEASWPTFPVPGTAARTLYLGPGGSLNDAKARSRGTDVYTSNPKALPLTNFTGGTGGGGLWGNATQWSWKWQPNPTGTAVSYVTAPLKATTVVVGAGAVTAWIRSSTLDVDLQATISEVDATGHETFVQNGYLRASERKLATTSHTVLGHPSTLLEPVPSFTSRDARPMPRNQFVKVTIPLYYSGHAYRAGTRIRVTIAAPNGAQPVWSFGETYPQPTQVSIAYSPSMPSSLVLPVVPGVAVTTAQPACPSLRNQPCRPYVRLVNRTG
jgi:predicted acyl esterase